jgi:hypothetical protein
MKYQNTFRFLSLPLLQGLLIGLVSWLMGVSGARAGLTVDIHLYHDTIGYYTYPYLSTNGTTPDYPVGLYHIVTPDYPSGGSQLFFTATPTNFIFGDTNGNLGGGTYYGDYNSLLHGITNGLWSIFVTNSTSTNEYDFAVAVTGLSSNDFGAPAAVVFPAQGAQFVTNQPLFTWTGPANWLGTLNVEDDYFDTNRNEYYEAAASLAPDQTTWPCPLVLPDGTNQFSVDYRSNATPYIVASAPTNQNAQTISGWISTATLETDFAFDPKFTVGMTPDTGPSDLVAHYTFDNSSNLGQDSSGNGNDLTFNGGVGVTLSSQSQAGSGAAYFDGYSFFSYASTPTNILNTLAGNFTLSFWINTTDNDGNEYGPAYAGEGIVTADVPGAANDIIPAALDGGEIGFNTGPDDDTLNTTTDVNDGNYHHIVITRDQGTGVKQIYIDGVLNNTDTATMNLLSDPQLMAIGCQIDASQTDPNNANPYNFFQGLLDDVQLYSKVLDATDVTFLFNNPGSTVGSSGAILEAHYPFDAASTNIFDSQFLSDTSGNGYNISGPSTFDGTYPYPTTNCIAGNTAAQLDGSNLYFLPTNLLAVIAGSYSISLWLETTQVSGNDNDPGYNDPGIIWAGGVAAGYFDSEPMTLTGSKLGFYTGANSYDTLHSVTSINTGAFTHIVVTRDLNSGIKQIFINGNLDSTDTGDTNLLSGSTQLVLGASLYNYGVAGAIDDVQFYSNVLSSTQIQYMYGHPGSVAPASPGGGPPQDFNTALNTTNLDWLTSGDANWFVESSVSLDGLAAQSGSVTGQQVSVLQTTISGPGAVYFNWMTTNTSYDGFYVEFDIDGNYQDEIYGDQAWSPDGPFFPGQGTHTLTWTTYANGDNNPNAAAFLDQVAISNVYPAYVQDVTLNGQSIGLGYHVLNLLVGTNVVITNEVLGIPPPTYVWYKNNQLLPSQTNNTLVFTNLQLSDTGYYIFQTHNQFGGITEEDFVINAYLPTDLQPLGLSYPATMSSASYVPFMWTVTNTGPGAVSNVYDNVNFTQLVSGQTVAEYNTESQYVAAASTYTVSNLFRSPNVQGGTYTLSLNVNANNAIIETTTNNNTLLGPPVTIVNPDLQPGNLSIAMVTNLGGTSIALTYNTTNNGPGDIAFSSGSINWYDEVYVSTNPVLDSTAVALYQINQRTNLAAGANFTTVANVTLPNPPSGTYYLIVALNAYNSLYESNKTNNQASIPIQLREPDLTVTNITAPASVATMQQVPISFVTVNLGDALASNPNASLYGFQWYDFVYLSTNTYLDNTALGVDDLLTTNALAPGQAETNSVLITVPEVHQGNYYLLVQADSSDYVKEEDKTNNVLAIPIQILTPDLEPVSITTPAGVIAQSTAQISWNVTNLGVGVAYSPQEPWYDSIYISTNAQLNTYNATLLGDVVVTNMVPAGGSYSETNTITIPDLPGGTYYLAIFVNAGNYLYESNRNNNILSIPITVSTPDLAATGLTAETNFSSQEPLSVVYAAANIGAVTAPAGWDDLLYLSPDGILETNNILMAETIVNTNLQPGGSYTNLVNSTIPGVPAGDYSLLLDVDGNNFFQEANTANNLLTQPVHIVNPDLVPTNFVAPISLVVTQYNQQFEADWTVVNQGAGSAYVNWSDNVYISPTNVLDTNAVNIGYDNQFPVLDPGAPYLGFANSTLPNGLRGNYYLLLSVNDSGSLYESKRTNNILARPIQLVIPPVPILSVLNVQSATDAWSGQQILVTWTLTNAGAAPVSGTFDEAVNLCSDAAGDNPQLYGSFEFTGTIQPGQAISREEPISLPIYLQGLFWIQVQTDVNHNVFEFTDRTNDTLVASQPLLVHLTPTPNLEITSIQSPTNTFSSDTVTVSWVETNAGTGPTGSPNWNDGVYLCDTTNLATANYRSYLGYAPNQSFLAPGTSYANSLNVMIPRGIDGTYYFIVVADIYNAVYEGTNHYDDSLASAPAFILATPPPDLEVASVTPPHNAFSGQPIAVSWAVTNYGLGQTMPAETNWSDRVYISTNVVFDATAVMLGDVPHNGGLDPGQGYSKTATLTLPVALTGTCYVYVTCDINNQVYEGAFEGNNTTMATYPTLVALTPPPDLVGTILNSPTNALASHNFSVTYSVANEGSTVTPNTEWSDNLYVSTNAIFSANDAVFLATSVHGGALAPGASYLNTIGVVLPDTYTGTNYVFVLCDAYNQVFELDKTNNLAMASNQVVIVSQPADLVPISLQAPATINVGDAMSISWSVTNEGVGDTAISQWNDALILSQNTLLGAPSDVVLLNTTHYGLLEAGAGYAVSNQLAQLPAGITPGTYYLFLDADYNNSVYEGTNPSSSLLGPIPITVTAHSADLQVTAGSGPTNAYSGTAVTVNWTERNGGNLSPNSSTWLDEIYLSQSGVLDGDSILLGYVNNATNLVPGAAYTNSLTVTLPVNVQSNYYFIVEADGLDQVIEPGLKFNNVYTVTPPIYITLSQIPDLAVTSVTAPTEAYEGQPFSLTWTVQNIGTAPASGLWDDTVYLSLDQVFDPVTATYLGYVDRPANLAPGASYTNTASFLIPEGYSGPYYVFVSSDANGAVYERGPLANGTAYSTNVMQVQLLPPVDLVAGTITIPANATPGQNLTVTYTVSNQGSNTALGSWQDSLFISPTTNWDVTDPLFAKVQHTGDVPPGGSYTNTVTAPFPGLVPGDYYVIVRSDILNHLVDSDRSNSLAASLTAISTEIPTLTLGTPSTGNIDLGQSVYYQFDATNGQTIHIQLNTGAPLADNELYVSYGQMPTLGQFDYAANDPFVSDPDIYIAITNTGTYYVLGYSEYVPASTPYSMLAEVLPFTVTAIQPSIAGDQGDTTFEVRGAFFDSGTQFTLSNGTNTINAQNFTLSDSSTAYVTFSLLGAQDGTYNLLADSDNTNFFLATLTNCVEVVPGNGPAVNLAFDGDLYINLFYINSILIDYGNSGDADAEAPLILVNGQNGTEIGTTESNVGPAPVEILGRSLTGPPNVLREQTSDSIEIYYFGGGELAEMRAVQTTSIDPISDTDWTNIESAVRPPGLSDTAWASYWWYNIRPRIGSTWGNYVQFLNRISQNFPAEERDVRAMIGSLYTNQPNYVASIQYSGTLYDSAGSPLVNVPVGLYQQQNGELVTGGSATTDGNGNFTISNVAPGTYQVSVLDGSREFDMNRVGLPDSQPPSFTASNADMTAQNIYCYIPPSPTNQFNDGSAQMAVDSAGVLHAVWLRDGKLWHARYVSGQWVETQTISGMDVTSFSFAASGNMVNNTSPGLMVVFASGTGNNSDLYYVVATQSGSTDTWSAPAQMTSDNVQDSAPAIIPTLRGPVEIVDLKQNQLIQDDTDLYDYMVNVNSANLPAALTDNLDFSPNLNASSSCNFSKSLWSGPIGPFTGAIGMAGTFSTAAAGCGFNIQASLGGTFGISDPGNFGLSVNGSGFGSASWSVDPIICAYRFDSANLGVTVGATFTYKNALLECCATGFGPPGRLAYSSYTRFQTFLNNWGVPLRIGDTESFGVQFTGTGSYTQGPAPFTNFRVPDKVNTGVASVTASIALMASIYDKSDMLARAYGPPPPPDNAAINKGSGGGFGASGTGTANITFDLWPNFDIKSTSVALNAKLEWGIYSLTYSISTMNPSAVQYHPSDLGPFDLPPDVTFSEDPSLDIGTTNVYGTNVLFPDIYRDGAPALALDGNGKPFMTWFKEVDPYSTEIGSHVYISSFDGTNWLAPFIITNSIGFNGFVNAALDPQGRPMAVWVHSDTSTLTTNSSFSDVMGARTNASLYYSLFDGTSWGDPQPIPKTLGSDNSLSVSKDAAGNLIAVWIAQTYNQPDALLTSTWNGTQWSPVVQLASGTLADPVVQTAGGSDVVLWTVIEGAEDDLPVTRIFQSTSANGVWSSPTVFSPATPASSSTPIGKLSFTPKGLDSCSLNFDSLTISPSCCPCQNGIIKSVGEGGCLTSTVYDTNTCIEYQYFHACPKPKSADPNDITGPQGYGPQQWVSASSPLSYTIQFLNDPAVAQAPAKVVTITMPLDKNFDPRTFRLGNFGFAGMNFIVPTNSAFYETTLDFTTNNGYTNGYLVEVFAGVDVASSNAFWTFTTIDPNTGDVPQNPFVGFLPIDTVPPQGEGYVTCSVSPKPGVTTGTGVGEQATIVFDNQAPLATPVALNVLEAGTPASSVTPLPPVTLTPNFDVAWQGVSVPGSPGIASYDIYVSQNGTGFLPWLLGTTLSDATYAGQPGSTYAFYSVAHDNSGAVQTTPTQADTSTFISTNLPPVIAAITNVVVAPDNVVQLKVSATDPNGDQLTYSLAPGAPVAASIVSTNGAFYWAPTRAYAETTNSITVQVTDNGAPPLTASQTFLVTVLDYLELDLGITNVYGGQSATLPVTLSSSRGVTNLSFTVLTPTNTFTNWAVVGALSQVASATVQDLKTNIVVALYTQPGQLLQGTQQVAQLSFLANSNQYSRLMRLPVSQILANKPDSGVYSNYLTQAGTVVVVNREPLLQAGLTNQDRFLLLFGRYQTNYQLQYTTNLLAPSSWQPLFNYTQTNSVINSPLGLTNPVIFYRLLEQ